MTTRTDARRILCEANPVPAAMAQALSRDPAFDDMADWIMAVAEPEAAAGDPSSPVRLGLTPSQRRRRTAASLGTAAVVVAALAIVLSGPVQQVPVPGPAHHPQGQPSLAPTIPGASTTPWRAARPLAHARFSAKGGHRGSWELVGDIVGSGWRLDTSGPRPGYLTCPTTTACYVTGNGATSDTGPSDFDSLYVSGDGGSTWSVLPLPTGFTFTTPLTCAGATTCLAAGSVGGTAVLLATGDGGHQWTTTSLDLPGTLVALTCRSATTCSGLVAPASLAPIFEQGLPVSMTDVGEVFVRTTDGGRTWATTSLPVADRVTSLSCPTATRCVAVGYPPATPEGVHDHPGFVLVTTDGGATWTQGALPAGFGFGYLSKLSCADALHCMALGSVTVPNSDECGEVLPTGSGSFGCSGGTTTMVSAVVATTDGGKTWEVRPLPSTVPRPSLDDVSCTSASTCWVSGSEAIPQGNNAGSSMVVGTTDGGATWSKATFTVPPGAPEDIGGDAYLSVGQISCPAGGGGCVALGSVDEGSASAPVYSDVP